MGVDTTTFVLEIINFLVLMALLKRFLYAPVKAAIEARKREQTAMLEAARAEHDAAAAVRSQYEQRLAEWAVEREQLQAALATDIAVQRDRALMELKDTLATERTRLQAQESQRQAQWRDQCRSELKTDAFRFVAQVMTRMASPALDARLLDCLQEDLGRLPTATRDAIRATLDAHPVVLVESSTPLAASAIDAFVAQVAAWLGKPVSVEARTTPELTAGVRVTLGAHRLAFNVGDELDYLREHVINGGF